MQNLVLLLLLLLLLLVFHFLGCCHGYNAVQRCCGPPSRQKVLNAREG